MRTTELTRRHVGVAAISQERFYFNVLMQKVESFLYKDVNVVITGNRDALTDVMASAGKVKVHSSSCEQRGYRNDAAQLPGTPRALVSVGLLSLTL